jgi:hypothetical protein
MAGEFERLLGVIQEQNESREQELSGQVQARTAELARTNTQLIAAGRRVQDELALARDMVLALCRCSSSQALATPGKRTPQWSPRQGLLNLVATLRFPLTLPDQRIGVLVAD